MRKPHGANLRPFDPGHCNISRVEQCHHPRLGSAGHCCVSAISSEAVEADDKSEVALSIHDRPVKACSIILLSSITWQHSPRDHLSIDWKS
jgi:hypothetical protein